VYCKGADSVILSRLEAKARTQPFMQATARHLDEFAIEGLRTLCVAYGQMDEERYAKWMVRFNEAATAMERRVERVRLFFFFFFCSPPRLFLTKFPVSSV
jgi:magnesium-transporting ATPase (P-type)